jgi:hypothetical protein
VILLRFSFFFGGGLIPDEVASAESGLADPEGGGDVGGADCCGTLAGSLLAIGDEKERITLTGLWPRTSVCVTLAAAHVQPTPLVGTQPPLIPITNVNTWPAVPIHFKS